MLSFRWGIFFFVWVCVFLKAPICRGLVVCQAGLAPSGLLSFSFRTCLWSPGCFPLHLTGRTPGGGAGDPPLRGPESQPPPQSALPPPTGVWAGSVGHLGSLKIPDVYVHFEEKYWVLSESGVGRSVGSPSWKQVPSCRVTWGCLRAFPGSRLQPWRGRPPPLWSRRPSVRLCSVTELFTMKYVLCVRLVSFLEARAETLHRGAHHYTGVSPSCLGGRDLTSRSALSP